MHKINTKSWEVLTAILVFFLGFLGCNQGSNAQSQNSDLEMLRNEKKNFDVQYADYIKQPGFPDALPLEPTDKGQIVGFGEKTHPISKTKKHHSGIDIPSFKGDIVKSTIQGVVIHSQSKKSGYGKHVIIESDQQVKILFAHLDSIAVFEGDRIKSGQIIGTVGNTGTSIRDHLHYEVHIDGVPINPIFTVYTLFSAKELDRIHFLNYESLD